MSYPTTLDSFINPTPTSDRATISASGQMTDKNTAILAIETKLGVDSSAVASTIDYLLKNPSSSNPGHKHTLTTGATDVTATFTELNKLSGATFSTTEANYLTGVTSNLQTQLTTGASNLTNHMADTTTHGTTGDIVGTTDTQVLSNKTLTKPVINGTNPTAATYTPATGSQTVALDCAANNMHFVTGHANGTAITFTIANATNNQPFIVSVTQGSGTVSTIAGWFATVRWPDGTTPTLTATLNKRDTFGFIRTGTNTYDGFIIGQNL
jgi:hypothetical protein